MRTYWCWDHNEELDKNTRSNTVGTRSAGDLDTRTAGGLMLGHPDFQEKCYIFRSGKISDTTQIVLNIKACVHIYIYA